MDDSDGGEPDIELRNATRRFERGLSLCLAKCRNLKALYLRFRRHSWRSMLEPPLISFDNVFQDLRYNWPGLLEFQIIDMAATGKELVSFLAAFPRAYINLGSIDLVAGGTWLTTFDELRAQIKPHEEAYWICYNLWEGGCRVDWLEYDKYAWFDKYNPVRQQPQEPKLPCTCDMCTLIEQHEQTT